MKANEFIQELHQAELPTVIDFWAPWCMPCKITKPILDQLGVEYAGRVNFRTINADENPELIRELKILGIPTLLIIDSNKEINRMVGAQPPRRYRQLFQTLASGEDPVSNSMTTLERFFRFGAGAILAVIAWTNANWWLLPIGLVVMFLGVYDRCPVWQAISSRLKRWMSP